MLRAVIVATARHPTQNVDRTVCVAERRGNCLAGNPDAGLIMLSSIVSKLDL